MSTTALFIELLITGLQTFSWLALLLFCVFGIDWIDPGRLKGYEAIMAVLLLPIVYPLGILTDYVADEVLRRWEIKTRLQFLKESNQSAVKLLIDMKDPSLANHLGYIRSKIRISRSSTLNFALLTLFSVVLTLVRFREIPGFPFWRVLFLEIILGSSLTVLAFIAWRRFNRSFFRWVAHLYNPNKKYSDDGAIEEAILEAKASARLYPLPDEIPNC